MVYGGGVSEDGFFDHLSKVIGDYDARQASVSHSKSGRQVSKSLQRQRIFDIAELAALPKGRAVVFACGMRPCLIATVPWMQGAHAQQVQQSLAIPLTSEQG